MPVFLNYFSQEQEIQQEYPKRLMEPTDGVMNIISTDRDLVVRVFSCAAYKGSFDHGSGEGLGPEFYRYSRAEMDE